MERMPLTSTEQVSVKDKLLSVKTFLSFALALIVFYLLLKNLDLRRVLEQIKQTEIPIYLGGFFVFYLSVLARGIRWKILLKNTGLSGKTRDITEVLFLSWFVNCIIPGKLGDLYRSYLIKKNYNFLVSRALGTVFVERTFDMGVLSLLFIVSGVLIFNTQVPEDFRFMLTASLAVVAIPLVLLYVMKKEGGRISAILPQKIAPIYQNFKNGTFGSIRAVPTILAFTVCIWFLEIGRFFLVTRSAAIDLPFSLVIFCALASSLLTTLPISPAGLGVVEVALVWLLMFFSVDKDTAFVLAFLDRLISYWSIIPLGYLSFVISKKT